MQALVNAISALLVSSKDEKLKSYKRDLNPQKQYIPSIATSQNPAFAQKYQLKDMLGVGGFGHIYSCARKSDGKLFAAKFIRKEKVAANRWAVDTDYGLIPMEAFVLKNVSHPGIIEFVELFNEAKAFIIVQELFGESWKTSLCNQDSKAPPIATGITTMKSMDLFEYLEKNPLSVDDAKYIFKQLLDIVDYLYSQHGLVHGDIKDENLLIDSDLKIKLIDFGAVVKSNSFQLSSKKSFKGTLEFAAPEILKGEKYLPEKSEVWSLGVFAYGLMYGGLPFTNIDAVLNGQLERREEDDELLWDLLDLCFIRDPKERATIAQIKNHQWLKTE